MWLEVEEAERRHAEAEAARRGQPTEGASTASAPDDAMWRAWQAAQRGQPFELGSAAASVQAA
jgi:hypothetical protein